MALAKVQTKEVAYEAVRVLNQILEHMYHHVGFVHFDIHGRNVLVCNCPDGKDRVVLLDFGLSEIHNPNVVNKAFEMYAVNLSKNYFDDSEDLYMHRLKEKYPFANRVLFGRVYDIARSVVATCPKFREELVKRFTPGLEDIDTWQEIDSDTFSIHFRVAFRCFDLMIQHQLNCKEAF